MATDTEDISVLKRKLILRDSLVFLSLILITSVLSAFTLFLFRSFMEHRADLAQRWASRGEIALKANHPEQAIAAYRTALSYSPDEHDYELALAQALGESGRTEEAFNYFMGMREVRPGDGFLNLQLARLSAKRRDVEQAVNFYRASIYGTWEGNGIERRRDVRLELARYLIQQHQLSNARNELLVIAGNASDDPQTDLALAKLLEQAAAPADALTYYQKAVAKDPRNVEALQGAGRLAFATGDYATAHRLLERAAREQPGDANTATLLAQTERILQLQPAETLRARERVTRILAARSIAKQRLADCTTQLGTLQPLPAQLQVLTGRWAGDDGTSTRAALLQDTEKQAAALQLVYDTEIETDQVCSAPAGDDALLLLLAHSSRMQQP